MKQSNRYYVKDPVSGCIYATDGEMMSEDLYYEDVTDEQLNEHELIQPLNPEYVLLENRYDPKSSAFIPQTQADVNEWLKRKIPTDVWDKYIHLSYEEMLEEPELEPYTDYLKKAIDWWYKEE